MLNNTLWMGDLDPWMDHNYLSNVFLTHGFKVTIKTITPSTYCFIQFSDNYNAKLALLLNKTKLPLTHKLFNLNWATGFVCCSNSSLNDFSVFVGDLPQNATDDILLLLFSSKYPSTKSAKVVVNHFGLSKG